MTTTIGEFWGNFATTTFEEITGQWNFFQYAFGAVLVIFLLAGLYYGLTYFFRGRRKKGR